MSDFIWYTRLLVWVGCGALLLESIAGRSFGLLTLLAVVFVVVGLCGFIAGLALDGRSLTLLTVLGEAPQPGLPHETAAAEPGPERDAEAPAASPACSEGEYPDTTRQERRFVESPARGPETARTAAASASSAAPGRVETRELGREADETAQICLHCGRRLVAGQLVAECWRCGALHHAACWTENRFHCARAGCDGEGSLEAPRPPAAGVDPG